MFEQAFDQCWESLHYIWRIRICDSWKIPTEDLLNSFSSFCSNGKISSVNRALDCKKKVILPKYISIFKQTCTWIKIYIIFSAKLIRVKKYIWQLKNFWYVLNLKLFHIFLKQWSFVPTKKATIMTNYLNLYWLWHFPQTRQHN